MTAQSGSSSQDTVVGYFSDGADAYRAINELIDEGFSASEIGAAFRSRRAGAGGEADVAVGEMKGVRELTETNPALSGSVGGPASGDQAVTPAGLSPGSGNAFAGAPSTPGPIPGAEIPQTLPHDLPETLPHDLPSTLRSGKGPATAATGVLAGKGDLDDSWVQHLKNIYGTGTTKNSTSRETAKDRNTARVSDQKFGTGEGTLGLDSGYAYSESAFEGSFTGMGLGAERARGLSGELGRGGAVVSVRAGERASLAESILERNSGRVSLEVPVGSGALDRESPVEVYGSMRNYYQPDDDLRRKAS